MAADKVHIYESSENEYRIEPPLVELKVGTNFKFRNHTPDDLLVFVEPGAFQPLASPLVVLVNSHTLSAAFAPAPQTTTGTLYTYYVVNPRTGKKGKGNSDPVLIVEN